jgi:predicted transcriptional regulator
MKIQFNGHSPSQRETELSQKELASVFGVMKQKFLDHIEYGKFNYSFPSEDQLAVTKLCDDHQVDVDYVPDRLNFFTGNCRTDEKSL